MIFQDDIWSVISFSEILGGIIATIFAVLSWWIVNKISELREWKTIVSQVNEAYTILKVDEFYRDMSIDLIRVLVDDLGEYNITKYLKLKYRLENGLHYFEGSDNQMVVTGGMGRKVELMSYGKPVFNYFKPAEGVETKQDFLEFVEANCQKAGIKLKN